MVIFSFQESKNLLRKVLKESKVFDWNRDILFGAVHEYFKDVLNDTLCELERAGSNKIMSADVTNYHFKPKEECAAIKLE